MDDKTAVLKVKNIFDLDFDLDRFYKYLNNDTKSVNLYMGEYMSQYSWAEVTLARLHWKK